MLMIRPRPATLPRMNPPAVLKSRVAIIDLGSNSARLMVADYQAGFAYRIADEISRRVRLSEGLVAGGALQEAPRARAVQTVRMFKAFCDAHHINRIIGVQNHHRLAHPKLRQEVMLRQLNSCVGINRQARL